MVGGVVVIALAAVGIFLSLKHEFVPPEDRGWFLSITIAPEGSTLAYTDAYQRRLEAIVAKTDGVESYFSVVGGFTGSPSRGFLFSLLKDWSKRSRSVEQIMGEVQPQFFGVPGVLAFATNPSPFGGGGQSVQFVVQHPDFDSLVKGVDTLLKRARQIRGLINVDSDLRVNKPELTVHFDRDRAEGSRGAGARCRRLAADAAWRAEDQHLHPRQ